MNHKPTEQELELLKYPIGKFTAVESRTEEARQESIRIMKQLAAELRRL